jgi:hypothetical protein
MCGIVGIIAKNTNGFLHQHTNIFTEMLYANALRGFDSTGVFGVNKSGNVDIKKMATQASHFISHPDYKEFETSMFSKYHFAIGHNRKATLGEKSSYNAHPFWDKDENICLIHNGTIKNQHELCKTSEVDSAAIANALGEADNIESVIEKIDGAFALIWYNVKEKTLYLIRNKERPLFISETNDSFILSSEDSLSYWIAKRNGQDITSTGFLKENVLYSIDLEDKTLYEHNVIEQKKNIINHLPSHTTTIHQNKLPTLITSTESTINDCPDTYYLCERDLEFTTPQEIHTILKKNDKLLCTIESYDPLKTKGKIKLNFLPINTKSLLCYSIMKESDLDTIALTKLVEVTIKHIYIEHDKINLVASISNKNIDYYTDQEDTIITEEMWFDDKFPLECTICSVPVKHRDIPKSIIDLGNMKVDVLTCPTCAETFYAK